MIRNKHSKLAIKLTPVLLGALFFAILCLPLQVRADGGGYDATTGTWGNYDFSYNSASHTLTLTGTGNINLPYDFSWYYWLDEIETIVLPDGFTGWNSGYRDSFFALPGVKEYQVSSGNTTYKVIDGVLYSKDGTTLIDYPNGTAGSSFTMPSSVTKLGEASFYKVNTIGAITLPSSVFKVGPNCFEASSLSKLTVNNRNIWFQSGAFRDCTSFTQIAIGPGKSSSDFFVYDNVLYHKDTIRVDGNEETQKAILLYPTAKPGTTFTIPSGVDYVDCAFRDALYIKTLKVPVTVKSVDQYAFTSNYIENFYIPSTVKFLDDVNLAMYAQTDSGKDVTIYGASGSDIAKFASSEGIRFVATADPARITPVDPFTFGDDVIYVSNAPANVKATVSGSYNQVKLTWSRSIDANGYWVEYKTSSASKWSTAAYTTNLGIIKSNLNAGTTYMFKVTPYTTVSGRRYFGPAKTVTAKTLSLKVKTPTVKKASKTKVKVSWKNIAAESGYQISKSTKKSGTTIVATYKTTKGTSKKISAKKGKKYYYKVRAYKIVNGAKVYGPWTSAKAFKL